MKFILFFCVLFLCVSLSSISNSSINVKADTLGETLAINSWSSTGGSTQNKDNNQDIMYLASANDAINFSVQTNQVTAVNYEWQVNKTVEVSSTGNSFDWKVPQEKGVWEIHLRCWNENGEANMEWAISDLVLSEAPDLFDSFSDMHYLSGTRTEKDPWERLLPQWSPSDPRYTVLDANDGYLKRSGDDSDIPPTLGINQPISVPSSTKYGTWKFRYRFPDGNISPALAFSVEYDWSSSLSLRNSYYGKMSDSHHHSGVYVRPECAFSFDYDGTGWPEDGQWHEVTIIRTPDTWVYLYTDHTLESYVQDKMDITPEKIRTTLQRRSGHQVYIDGFEVYENAYLFPEKEVSYGPYVWNYTYNSTGFHPEIKQGIIVKGKGVRLSDIETLLNDPNKFTYNAGTKTAIAYADLVIYDGTEFIMDNGETLKFNSTFDGERAFVLDFGANVAINNSTITSNTDKYFVWNNASSTTHFGRPELRQRTLPQEFSDLVGYSGGVWPLGNAGLIRFSAHNSTIDNTAHIFWDSPMELDITDTHFTNLHETDIGNYTGIDTSGQYRSRQRWFPKGDKSFWVYMDEVNTNKFNFDNISFSGAGDPVNITFLVNAFRDKLNVYNLDLGNSNIIIKKSLPQQAGQSHTWTPYIAASYEFTSYGGMGSGMDSRLGIVNSKFNNLIIPTDLAWGIPKYYLDVKVVDGGGNPVQGASVSVTNEVDDTNYPAENMASTQPVFDPHPSSANQYFYLSYQLIQGIKNSSQITDSSGHIPLPSDKSKTLILADYVKDQSSQTNFTYAISASKGGKTASFSGLDFDPSWYRDNPQMSLKSVVCNIDSGICQVENSNVTSVSTFSPPAGTHTSAQTITLSSTTSGASIYYTTNGTNPTISSTHYTAPFNIGATTTIKAIAIKANYANSAISSATYTINIPSSDGGTPSGGGSGGGDTTSITPVIVKTEIKSLVINLISLDLSVTNASQMMLSDTSSFLGSTWVNYTTNPTYTKTLIQTKLYLKFKSSTDIISSTVELTIPPIITNPSNTDTTPYPTGTLLKLSDSFKVYVIIEGKKKWISTPEVFQQLGYKWTNILTVNPTQLNTFPDYEDNLIRAIGDYKVYLVVSGVKRHIPNPIIFLDYGFKWNEVKDVPQETIDKYKPTYLIKQSGSTGIYYVNPQEIRKLIPSTEVFNSYNDKNEDIQIISKTEMDFYPLSNLIKLNGSNDIYLIEGNIKKRIPNPQVFNKYKLNWNLVMSVNQTEFNFYQDGGELK